VLFNDEQYILAPKTYLCVWQKWQIVSQFKVISQSTEYSKIRWVHLIAVLVTSEHKDRDFQDKDFPPKEQDKDLYVKEKDRVQNSMVSDKEFQ